MCGITGIISKQDNSENLKQITDKMCSAISHRGPEDFGIWQDEAAGLAFGHRRLRILELSPLGAQPMISRSGRWIITFNGEVFNFKELRVELESTGANFKGNSDTEVMVEAIEQWGLEVAVRKFVGMFAFAVWDKETKTLSLVRDRLGIKPLYYGFVGNRFCFASELNGIDCIFSAELSVRKEIVPQFLSHHYIAAPNSIYNELYKLPQGSILTLPFADFAAVKSNFSPLLEANEKYKPQRYWSLSDVVDKGCQNPYLGNDSEAEEALNKILSDSVRLRMISDVPLGAFLSGGIDSSMIVAMMKQYSSSVETFSIGFKDANYDEAPYAKAVADHLGTKHTELYFSEEEASSNIPNLVSMFDEPFADSSQLPTFVISRLARSTVTVSLSGEGGDELFCGYPRYRLALKLHKLINSFPTSLHQPLISFLKILPLQDLASLSSRALPKGKIFDLSDQFFTFCEQSRSVLMTRSLPEIYDLFNSYWIDLNKVFLKSTPTANILLDHPCWKMNIPDISKLQLFDMSVYLADDLLTKSDRTSMSIALETRVPLLDHRLVEFVWSLPENMKYRDGQSKWLLRKVLQRYVPKKLFDRPKMGFSVPISSWLRGNLRDWAEELLSEKALNDTAVFQTAFVRQLWQAHLKSSNSKLKLSRFQKKSVKSSRIIVANKAERYLIGYC